ncbi:hypothetical protein [Microbacterium aquimaris]|uniref:4Fe-4S Wbl-type domain-containing protein n=1 Tax=Microbacterium aquimaris TaxID=459816 RepID=A0ABU5N8I6_9MICO|nr:hypothetical protein [Microbacterium aquimaris]MDZ8162345.1 hypothetical protein [Microbacterium aquimaris]
MARGDNEWASLRDELKHTAPACDGDDRFIQDDLTETEQNALSRICDRCPIQLRTACKAYGAVTRPPGSYYAGTYYPAPKEG